MADADREWLAEALARWQAVETAWLGLAPRPLPTVIAIDARCRFDLPRGAYSRRIARSHDGKTFELGEKTLPVAPLAFADGSGRFVMALPSVWRDAGYKSDAGIERVLVGILLHEIMHTRQSALANAALEGMDENASDDLVQDAFQSDPAYVAAYQAERDLLFAAAEASDTASARRMAAEALAMMQARRARWFTGKHTSFATLEDVFLTMEGAGQWLIFRHLHDPRGAAFARSAAIVETRNGGKYWTQDQGLALFLLLDRLLPDWRTRAFREPDWRANRLLEAAVALPETSR